MEYSRLLIINLTSLGAASCLLTSCPDSRPPGADYLADVGGPVRQRPANGEHHPPPAIPDDISYWDGDGVSGKPLVKINRSQQKAYFYKGGVLVGVARISSGDEVHDTPKGTYRITEKIKDHRSTRYGIFRDTATGRTVNDDVDTQRDKPPPGAVYVGAPMPNFMRFNGGVGMHTGYLPGFAASHGCVRMPHQMSTKFFENVAVGTPVIVE
jgi:hypothetical protein